MEIYDYKNNANAKEDVNSVWVNQFGTIANLNNLLYRLEHEGKDVVLTDDYWNLMKGEALGLRAFHYFDLLHQLPDKAAYVNYLKALAASPDLPPASPAATGA
mgnify:CR=1 FL=1